MPTVPLFEARPVRTAVSLACAAVFLGLPALVAAQSGDAGSVNQLQEVVVTATGFEQVVEDAPASITVLPRAELEKRAYKDVTDALKDVPGVVITGGGSSSDISIRGMAPAYTMILVDGKRQNSRETRPNSDGPGMEQGWLPPMQAIERIEVVRGPMSSLYGSDAMGGVINIITRKVPGQWSGSLRSEATVQEDSDSGNIYQSNFYLGGPIADERLGLQIYGQAQRRQEDKFEGGFNKQNADSITGKLSFTPNRDHDLIAEVSRTRQERTATPGKSTALTGRGGAPAEVAQSKYDKNLFSLTHVGRWSENVTSNSYVQYDEVDNPGRDMYLKNTEVNSQWNVALGRHIVSAGLNYKQEDLTDLGNQYDAGVGKLKRYQWALFAEDDWFLTDAFTLTSGLRMTRDENYGTHWTPRMYGVWHATDQFSLKGGVSTGFKAPSLRAAVADWGQATGGAGGNAIIMGNPNLKPEKSISEEIGIVWDNRQGWASSLTFFNTDFKDKISELQDCPTPMKPAPCTVPPDPHVYDFTRSRFNVDKAIMRGIEATSTWRARPDLRLSANYTYTYSKQKSGDFSGRPLNKMPRHMANATLDWDVNPQLDLWSRVNFRGKTSEYLSRISMAEGTPSFTFVDLGLNYKLGKNLSAGFGIYNLFDKRVTDESFGAVYDGRRYWAYLTASF